MRDGLQFAAAEFSARAIIRAAVLRSLNPKMPDVA
jgi:hypothetical protein